MKIRKNFTVLSFTLTIALLLINLVGRAEKPDTAVASQTTPSNPTGTGSSFLYLPLVFGPDNHIPVASMLVPFDANASDLNGPASWATNYEITRALTNLPMLDRVMGLANDGAGNRYYATGVDESGDVSHSFDQRLLFDGSGIIEHHLGDAYPRTLVFGRDHVSYPLFHIKGDLGENNTRTRLGNLALIENDPTYGYLALFATENSTPTGDTINGPRNLAIVLWEEWQVTGSVSSFNGVYGMVIDDAGTVLQPAKLLTTAHHLHRGDDAFLLDGRAGLSAGC